MTPRQVYKAEVCLFTILQYLWTCVVIIPCNLHDHFRNHSIYFDSLPRFLKVYRIAKFVAQTPLCGGLLGIPQMLALKNVLGDKRILLKRVDRVCEPIGKRRGYLPLDISWNVGFIEGRYWGDGGLGCQLNAEGFCALGKGRKDKSDVRQRGGSTCGEV